ncbi:MAG: hypothetical protein Q8R55_02695 [Candidatus Taylorbacteria bacterium]|nr:hypothetical protein [Candidatus Taylorbacteria bacterium]
MLTRIWQAGFEKALKTVFITLAMSPLNALLLMMCWNSLFPNILPEFFDFHSISYYEAWLLTLLFTTILQ